MSERNFCCARNHQRFTVNKFLGDADKAQRRFWRKDGRGSFRKRSNKKKIICCHMQNRGGLNK